jgi:hypothetical protein
MKIRVDQKIKIDRAIYLEQRRSTVRTLSHERLIEAVERAEKQLKKLRIPEKYWKGCKIRCVPELPCNSYNKGYPVFGTWGHVEKFSTGWFVTGIARTFVGSVAHGREERDILRLSPLAKESIPTEWK